MQVKCEMMVMVMMMITQDQTSSTLTKHLLETQVDKIVRLPSSAFCAVNMVLYSPE
jgi:hypothetical protein